MTGLYLEAPFAAFRTFTAGWYRPTATFLTPSAAYGLALNLAGIDSRLPEGDPGHDGKTPTTYIRGGLPSCRIALGVPRIAPPVADASASIDSDPDEDAFPRLQSVFQQLHNYPVGATGKERKSETHGNKYNIAPVRREFLSDLRAVVLIDGNGDLERRLRHALAGEFAEGGYGLPFLGDNAFLLDRCEPFDRTPARFDAIAWYCVVGAGANRPTPRAVRLTTWIDRADSSRTQSALFAPGDFLEPSEDPPKSAWVDVTPPPAAVVGASTARRNRKRET